MNSLLGAFGRLLNLLLNKGGYEIRSIPLCDNTMEGCIKRSKEKGLEIQTVIDIGASDGRWSDIFFKYYHDAHYFLVEAQKPHEQGLVNFCKSHPNSEYIIAAAGSHSGKNYFQADDLFGGVASETPTQGNCIVVPSITIDEEVSRRKLTPPFAIKMDTHGFELPILEGCIESLNNTNLLIIEAYIFKLHENAPKFYELCSYLDKKGFYPIDIAGLLWRKYDNSLWQMDIFFIRKNRREFTYNKYR